MVDVVRSQLVALDLLWGLQLVVLDVLWGLQLVVLDVLWGLQLLVLDVLWGLQLVLWMCWEVHCIGGSAFQTTTKKHSLFRMRQIPRRTGKTDAILIGTYI